MKRILPYIISLLSIALLNGCEHKELCMEHPHLVPVRVDAEWDQFCELPMGMSVFFFPKDGSEMISVQSHTPHHASVRLAVNTYDVLVFNDLMDEFGNVKFRGMEHLSTAEAYACALHSQMRMKKSTDEPTVADPERLGIAIVRDFKVTQEMLEKYWHQRDMELPIEENVLTVYPENVVYVVDVKVHVHGIQYVRSVESSLSGMSGGHLMDSGHRSSNRVTHLQTGWHTVSTSATDPNEGYLHSTFMSFGLPFGHEAKAEENTLNMTVLLVDNETVMDFAFRVGDRFQEDRWSCSPALYLEFGKPTIDNPNPDNPDNPDPDDPDKPDPDNPDPDDPDNPDPDDPDKPDPDNPDPDDPDDPGYDDPDIPIIFPQVKPEGTMDGGLTIDPGFDGDHSVEIKKIAGDKKNDIKEQIINLKKK